MFFHSPLYWFLMGAITILVMVGFKIFTTDRGWRMTWWKWVLAGSWYFILCLSFFTLGTLVGENEISSGMKLFLLGIFVSLTSGVGLWRLLGKDFDNQMSVNNQESENRIKEGSLGPTDGDFPEKTQG